MTVRRGLEPSSNVLTLLRFSCIVTSVLSLQDSATLSDNRHRSIKGINNDRYHIPSVFNQNSSVLKGKMKRYKGLALTVNMKREQQLSSSTTTTNKKNLNSFDLFNASSTETDTQESRQAQPQSTTSPVSSPTTKKFFFTTPSPLLTTSAPVISNNGKVKPTVDATFTVAPVTTPVPVSTTVTTKNTPTIQPSAKPILSVPLSVHSSSSPTAFLLSSSLPTFLPTQSPQIITNSPIVTPSAVVVTTLSPVAYTNNTPVSNSSNTDSDGSDEQTSSTNNIEASNENGKSNKAKSSWTIVTVLIVALVSMVLSYMVLVARHKYVQKHGPASTRRRRQQLSQEQPIDKVAPSGTNNMDLENEKTVQIIMMNDMNHHRNNHDNTMDVSPDHTFEIHLGDDEVYLSQPESNFLSTSEEEDNDGDEGMDRRSYSQKNNFNNRVI